MILELWTFTKYFIILTKYMLLNNRNLKFCFILEPLQNSNILIIILYPKNQHPDHYL
jgi:hypothetical protein